MGPLTQNFVLAENPNSSAAVRNGPEISSEVIRKVGIQTPVELLEELLSIPQVMRLTGESESCWRKRLGRRELPFVRLGANVRIKKSDLQDFIQSRTIAPKKRQEVK